MGGGGPRGGIGRGRGWRRVPVYIDLRLFFALEARRTARDEVGEETDKRGAYGTLRFLVRDSPLSLWGENTSFLISRLAQQVLQTLVGLGSPSPMEGDAPNTNTVWIVFASASVGLRRRRGFRSRGGCRRVGI
jgi:hypothetical protein